mmetsp:Transcript_29708/g.75637  ORF Transcript_29708/g.75637 Transcript_29708/m.75637 type:complete len:216 (+) Transcript_29708:608-1255(+)
MVRWEQCRLVATLLCGQPTYTLLGEIEPVRDAALLLQPLRLLRRFEVAPPEAERARLAATLEHQARPEARALHTTRTLDSHAVGRWSRPRHGSPRIPARLRRRDAQHSISSPEHAPSVLPAIRSIGPDLWALRVHDEMAQASTGGGRILARLLPFIWTQPLKPCCRNIVCWCPGPVEHEPLGLLPFGCLLPRACHPGGEGAGERWRAGNEGIGPP